MFDNMLDSSPAKRRRRNPWAFAASLMLEGFVLGVLILLPFLYTEALPDIVPGQTIDVRTPSPPPPLQQPVKQGPKRPSFFDQDTLVAPVSIPPKIAEFKEGPMPAEQAGPGVPYGVPEGQGKGPLGDMLKGITPVPPTPEPRIRIRVSTGVQEAKLIRKVQPRYPSIAQQARIQGVVELEAVISRDGTIQDLRIIGGHPLLAQAAREAVLQWRYNPTLLNNEPVEVVTLINVVFRLN